MLEADRTTSVVDALKAHGVQDPTAVEDMKRVIEGMTSQRRWYIIDPRHSRWLPYWDVITSAALLFTATITPYEAALLPVTLDALFAINRVVDLIFIGDILVQMVTAREQRTRRGSVWTSNPRQIVRLYLRGWFVLDVFSVAVSAFDVYAALDVESATSMSRVGPTFRLFRVLRLTKLARVLRASRILKRWETSVAIDYAKFAIVKCLVGIAIICHWLACAWAMQPSLIAPSPLQSWLGHNGLCWVDTEAAGAYACDTYGSIYIAALYWSVMTLTTIGYGDVVPQPNNTREQGLAVAIMLLTSVVWAQVIGTYCGIVAALSPEINAFHETMDELNRFMHNELLPADMRRRLREYYHFSKHLRLGQTRRALLESMPSTLKSEVVWLINSEWLQKVYFLRASPRPFLVELSLSLVAKVYPPGDTPQRDAMYIVYSGFALYQSRIVTKGGVFGVDMILESPHLRSTAQARAMHFLEVFTTDRRTLIACAAGYPSTWFMIRRAAIMIALRREVILLAKMRRGVRPADSLTAAVAGAAADTTDSGGQGEPGVSALDTRAYIEMSNETLEGPMQPSESPPPPAGNGQLPVQDRAKARPAQRRAGSASGPAQWRSSASAATVLAPPSEIASQEERLVSRIETLGRDQRRDVTRLSQEVSQLRDAMLAGEEQRRAHLEQADTKIDALAQIVRMTADAVARLADAKAGPAAPAAEEPSPDKVGLMWGRLAA